jgi:hypothetical protein
LKNYQLGLSFITGKYLSEGSDGSVLYEYANSFHLSLYFFYRRGRKGFPKYAKGFLQFMQRLSSMNLFFASLAVN